MCRRSKWMMAAAVAAGVMLIVPAYFVLTRGTSHWGYSDHPLSKQETARHDEETSRDVPVTGSAAGKGQAGRVPGRKNATQQVERQSPPSKTSPLVPTPVCCANLANLDKDKVLTIGHRRKNKGFLTIGIPYASRASTQRNLRRTVQSLIQNTGDEDQRSRVTIVVFTSALDQNARKAAREVVSGFPEHIQSGLLQLIEAPKSFYPNLAGLGSPSLSDRVKVSIDGAFMLTYAAGSADFYLQLVDNVNAPPNYLQSVRDFIGQQEGTYWVALEFLPGGFMGKLIRGGGRDMQQLVHLLTEYNKEHPIESLFSFFKSLNVQQNDIIRRPPLFLFW